MAEKSGTRFEANGPGQEQAVMANKQGQDVAVTRSKDGHVAVQIIGEKGNSFENTSFSIIAKGGKATASHFIDTDAPGTATKDGLTAEEFVQMNPELVRQVADAVKGAGVMLDKDEATAITEAVNKATHSGKKSNMSVITITR